MAKQLAERLSGDGHSVTMVVPFPNRPGGKFYEGYRRGQRRYETAAENYRIVRCSVWPVGPRRKLLDRVLENLTFGLSSAWNAWCQGRPDVIVVETWPLFAVQCMAWLAGWWRVPFVYYVQDVYPEAVEHAGYIKESGRITRLLRRWDKRLCVRSARTIVISQSMLNLVCKNRHLDAGHFEVIQNWQDMEEFPAKESPRTWRDEEQIPSEAFLAMFGGTMGHVSSADILVDVAERLAQRSGIQLVCVGDGIHKPGMEERIRTLCLGNIRMMPFQPRERVAEVQRSADVLLLTMDPNTINSSVPSKLISYLAAGRPIVCSANPQSTVARIVTDSGSGIVVASRDAHAIAEAILRLSEDRSQRDQMGERARACYEANFTLDRAYRQFAALLRSLANLRRASRSAPIISHDRDLRPRF
jgi:colanic acid biosynthesis glycosyl transferase WcaI